MSDLDELVSVTIQVDSSGLATENFGIIGIASHNCPFSDWIRYYGSDLDVAADFPDPTSPESIHAATIFAQTPHPSQIAIMRMTDAITLKYALSPIQVTANHPYTLNVSGQGVIPTSYTYVSGTSKSLDLSTKTAHMNTVVEATGTFPTPTLQFVADGVSEAGTITDSAGVVTVHFDPTVTLPSDVEVLLATATSIRIRSANTLSNTALVTPGDVFAATPLAVASVTNDEITSNLVALLNSTVGKNFTATQAGASHSHTIQVLGSAPGDWFEVDVADALTLKNAITNTGDPTANLTTVMLNATVEPYMIDTIYNSASYVEGAASWCEANGKTYAFDVPETDVLNATSTGTADTVDTVGAAGYARTLAGYHPRQQEALSASLEGRVVSLNPGLWTAAFKTLEGPTPIKITGTQRVNLKAKHGNAYLTKAAQAVTLYGTVGSSIYKFWDVIVGLDFFINDIQTSAAAVLFGNNKIGYDDADIAQVAASIRGAIQRAASDAHKIISLGTPGSLTDPLPTITFPAVASIDPTVRALRNLPNGVLTCRLLGAVQSIALTAVITF